MAESGTEEPQPQQTPEPSKPPPLSNLSIPDRDDREAVLEFLRVETLAQLEKINEQYSDIVKDIDQKVREIPNQYYHHKMHAMSYFTSPAYHIVRLILYDRYIAEKPQFIQSNDPDFLALAIVTAKGHDAGFTVSQENHEEESVKITTDLMEKHGFMIDKIPDVKEAILGTKFANIGQDLDEEKIKSNPLIALIMDADLANFGEAGDNKFMTDLVAKELGKDPNDPEFLADTLQLMQNHKWQTDAAKWLFGEQKAENIQALKERIQAAHNPPS